MGGEQPQGWNVQGRVLQKRDDLAERGEQDLHHPFHPRLPALRLSDARAVATEEASANADFIKAVQDGDVFKPKSLFCSGSPPRAAWHSPLMPWPFSCAAANSMKPRSWPHLQRSLMSGEMRPGVGHDAVLCVRAGPSSGLTRARGTNSHHHVCCATMAHVSLVCPALLRLRLLRCRARGHVVVVLRCLMDEIKHPPKAPPLHLHPLPISTIMTTTLTTSVPRCRLSACITIRAHQGYGYDAHGAVNAA
jgi:hypothetical protein